MYGNAFFTAEHGYQSQSRRCLILMFLGSGIDRSACVLSTITFSNGSQA